MNTIRIDSERCKKDGLCIKECPFALLSEGSDGVPLVVEGGEEMCINCGHCLAICPSAAITVNELSSVNCEKVDKKLTVSPEQALQLFKSRRSTRSYKNDAVETKVLMELLDMARWVPSSRNSQPVNWVVIQKKEDVEKLSGMVVDWLRENELLPGVVAACEAGNDMINRNAPCLLIAHASSKDLKPVEDCTIALTSVEAAATAYGLGACWAGFFMNASKEHKPIQDYLDLPQDHKVYGALMLGYPKVHYRYIPPRKTARVDWR